ncbi:MAG: hypothetical protein A3C85_02790 [Candidatus Doudnabacteria bacterium RIFCSPHIGHO2_02_FULL_48_21]|uniref:Uncharacterized protein n=1 Tax=Candidatus Doudnabacteria bacterium RIFCSPLOWO2_02_FULL_48_13 TaxID=1817845 RepID=A0A1F5Q9T9_9BACT|nr:MAG: hypothetical protein A3K05_03455 [Candidatus Doudnabacteria bacterium RIFCSPHIGHO2_01_48_18]OGE79504.1 MAG: hypothetical protein A2668_00175 [Candidatus Doudnabacteria bacterium RIFCSPHIGHO2_01_FULL_48_180]OGE91337.1 MAG: hypothetical protein A3F44_03450 [Candidatus Doudnabacteria bacterium RIFCSPHIGHO2_12_FULL_47_25]OGE92882.1 MAG: hypothetical protein A3C85_02790 [Candidatus Doudnabacteria bacterium RIFCSPHIGHO2_02_FULL_48_21]OGE96668.1 MAG: hypothetical protein A3A83_01725 [Candidatu
MVRDILVIAGFPALVYKGVETGSNFPRLENSEQFFWTVILAFCAGLWLAMLSPSMAYKATRFFEKGCYFPVLFIATLLVPKLGIVAGGAMSLAGWLFFFIAAKGLMTFLDGMEYAKNNPGSRR